VDVLHYCADVTEERKFEVMAKEINRTQNNQSIFAAWKGSKCYILRPNRVSYNRADDGNNSLTISTKKNGP